MPDSEGIPASTFDDVVLAPWNDAAALERVMKQHGHELAAVITEPIMANMGCILPREVDISNGYARSPNNTAPC